MEVEFITLLERDREKIEEGIEEGSLDMLESHDFFDYRIIDANKVYELKDIIYFR